MQVISTPDAPAAIGPYSQAIKSGDLVFLSGQIPLDPKTGAMVEGPIAAGASLLEIAFMAGLRTTASGGRRARGPS